jgi:hypothetical protein
MMVGKAQAAGNTRGDEHIERVTWQPHKHEHAVACDAVLMQAQERIEPGAIEREDVLDVNDQASLGLVGEVAEVARQVPDVLGAHARGVEHDQPHSSLTRAAGLAPFLRITQDGLIRDAMGRLGMRVAQLVGVRRLIGMGLMGAVHGDMQEVRSNSGAGKDLRSLQSRI